MSEKKDNNYLLAGMGGLLIALVVAAFCAGIQVEKSRQSAELHSRKVTMEKLATELASSKARLEALKKERRVIQQTAKQIQRILETFILKGKASYYGDYFHGRATTSGRIFNKYEFTAASEWLPLHSEWVVQSNATGKMVVVTITDRFPSTKGRIIDLSEAAFLAISPLKHGVIAVTMWPFIKEVGA